MRVVLSQNRSHEPGSSKFLVSFYVGPWSLQMVASLGPPAELLGGRELGRGDGHHTEAGVMTDKEAATTDAFLANSVQVHPDKLSCGQMLLTAARTFAAQKIKTLVADVEAVAGQLG